jgi:hypothetical protein
MYSCESDLINPDICKDCKKSKSKFILQKLENGQHLRFKLPQECEVCFECEPFRLIALIRYLDDLIE